MRHPRSHQSVVRATPTDMFGCAAFVYSLAVERLEAFVGRVEELAELARRVRAGAFVTVTGLAGMGKSQLARRLGETIVDLDGASDVAGAIAHALGIGPLPRPSEARVQAVAKALDAASGIVVLDNCDGAADEVRAIVAARKRRDGGAALVATARAPIGISGEDVFPLGPLAEADAIAMVHALAEASEDDAAHIARALEGIPLALALAAGRARAVGSRAVAARIEQGRPVLPGGAGPAAVWRAAIDASVAASWAALPGESQKLLVVLSLFCAPVGLDALEAVVADDRDVLDDAEALLVASLVVRRVVSGDSKLALLGVVREFARARLAERPDLAALTASRVAWLVSEVASLTPRAYGQAAESALAELASIAPEVAEVFPSVAASKPGAAAGLVLGIADAILFGGALGPAHPSIADAVNAADRDGSPSLRSRARTLLARATLETSAPAKAAEIVREALKLAEDAALPREAADARRTLGWALVATGAIEEAKLVLAAAEEALTDLASVRGQADASCALAVARMLSGDVEGAKERLTMALALHVASGDVPRRRSVETIGRTLHLLPAAGDADSAAERASLTKAIAEHRARGHAVQEALAAFRLSLLTRDDGDPALARGWLEQARAAAFAAGVPIARADELASHLGAPAFRVSAEAREVVLPTGERLDFTRRGSLRRVLAALVDRRRAAPGEAMTADALLTAGWPGERVRYEAGQLRVYTAIRRLRRLGLEHVLLTRDDGYLLDPSVAFEASTSPPRA